MKDLTFRVKLIEEEIRRLFDESFSFQSQDTEMSNNKEKQFQVSFLKSNKLHVPY